MKGKIIDRANCIGLEGDLDRPIHRIFPFYRFEEILRSREIALVAPCMWVDPREDPLTMFVLTPDPRAGFIKPQRQVADYLPECWAQCWSTEAESDVLLRAYSRVELDPLLRQGVDARWEGVRVTSTPRRLLAAMERWASFNETDHFYLAAVVYEPEDEFGVTLANRLSRYGPCHFGTPEGRAESLRVKRARFRDEREVRLICVDREGFAPTAKVRTFRIEPDELFTEVAFDPRLYTFEQRERAERLRAAGFKGRLVEDTAYSSVVTLVPMGRAWPEPSECVSGHRP